MKPEEVYLDMLKHKALSLEREIGRVKELRQLNWGDKAWNLLKKAELDMIEIVQTLDEARCWEMSKERE